LQAIGLEPRRIRRIVWTDALLVGALGTTLGLASGVAVSRLLLGYFSRVSELVASSEIVEVHLRGRTVAVAIFIGLLVSLLASIEPAHRSTSRPPLEVLIQNMSLPTRAYHRLRVASITLLIAILLLSSAPSGLDPLVRVALLFSSGLCLVMLCVVPLILRAMDHFIPLLDAVVSRLGHFVGWSLRVRPTYTALIVGAFAGVTGAVLSLLIVLKDIDHTYNAWFSTRYPGALMLTAQDPFSSVTGGTVLQPELVSMIRQVPSAATAETFQRTISYRGRTVLLVARSIEVVARHGTLPVLAQRSNDVVHEIIGGGVAVSDAFARRFSVDLGDRISLATDSGVKKFLIVAILRDYAGPNGTITMNLPVFDENWSRPGAVSVLVWPVESVERLEESMRSLVTQRGIFITRTQDLTAVARRTIRRYMSLLWALAGMGAGLAGTGLLVVMVGSVLERGRELALLRVAGATRFQVAAVVLGDGLLLGAAGALGGIVLGVPAARVLSLVLEDALGWTIADGGITVGVIVVALSAVGVAGIAATAPAWSSRSIGPAEALWVE
jgi:putative ABC transport system permease protein